MTSILAGATAPVSILRESIYSVKERDVSESTKLSFERSFTLDDSRATKVKEEETPEAPVKKRKSFLKRLSSKRLSEKTLSFARKFSKASDTSVAGSSSLESDLSISMEPTGKKIKNLIRRLSSRILKGKKNENKGRTKTLFDSDDFEDSEESSHEAFTQDKIQPWESVEALKVEFLKVDAMSETKLSVQEMASLRRSELLAFGMLSVFALLMAST
jgi:hypothetical protein